MSRHTISKPKANAKCGKRVCLTCRKAFNSKGIHNRICSSCKYNAREIDATEYEVAA